MNPATMAKIKSSIISSKVTEPQMRYIESLMNKADYEWENIEEMFKCEKGKMTKWIASDVIRFLLEE